MIAALLLALASQAEPAPAPAQARPDAVAPGVDRAAILARDPKGLARAPRDTWKGFDIAKFSDEAVLQPILRARDGILRGDLVGALGELQDVLAKCPDFPPALHMSGMVYFRLQRYGDSAEMLARYVEVAPEHVGDTRVLGHDLYTLGRYREARDHYARVLERAPQDPEAWRGSALAAWRLGDAPDALARIDRAIALAPQNDEGPSWKAAILFDEGELEAAQACAEAAIALDAFEPRTWFTLSRILEEAGLTAPAQNARRRFEVLAAASAGVRRAEARLLLEPRRGEFLAAWLDALVALGSPERVRSGLHRTAGAERGGHDTEPWRAELDACRFLDDRELGRTVASALEARAQAGDTRAWRALADWYEFVGDEAGRGRARAKLGR